MRFVYCLTLSVLLVPCMLTAEERPALFSGWQHSGSLFILTTSDGAALPATASVEGFPLLVRLNKATFDFSESMPHGEDLRFSSSDGVSLPYQIEDWDAARGSATVWVRVPKILGNARQELRVFWGKAEAKSESSGAAVFNESNGYLSVWHMGESTISDDAGTLTSKDFGTTPVAGIIGMARHLAGKQGVFGGDKIPNYPSGASAHSTEAWFRAERSNATIIGWGNEGGGRGSKIRMQLRSPPHVHVDSDFSDVDAPARLPLNEWIHVVHTYASGDGRIYINGELAAAQKPMLAIKTPSRLWLGGWYNNYDFVGDLDEVRVSKVTRSADWVRLEYENQKQMQTLAGPLVQPGTAFSISAAQLTVPEGQTATITAHAGGAQKAYWILIKDGVESVAGVDEFAFTFKAPRVTGDTQQMLRFKAVFANETKTKDIPITIKEAIPEPLVSLKGPAQWNGRDTIEIRPEIGNAAALQASGAGAVSYTWTLSGGAVIKEIAPDKLILKRSQFSGKLNVKVAASNGGTATVASTEINVTEPKLDPWVRRQPEKDEKPADNQFYAREDNNEGILYYNGTLDQPAGAVFLKIYADDTLFKSETQTPGADKAYAFTVKLKPGLIHYKVEFGTKTGATETIVQTVNNVVCGDAYIIQGQSNALATDTGEDAPHDTNDWIRSYGSPTGNAAAGNANLWCNPVWKARKGEKAELGYWGMELAKHLVESQKMPVCFFNGAVGGTRIDQHQRNPANPEDLTSIYGRLLWRVRHARLTHGIRGILWHQGENDQGADGPTGGFGWETYQPLFIEMSAGWKQDFPNVQHYYVFQIWPKACAMGVNGSDNMLREMQRTLPALYSNMSILSTLGIKPPGGCHYPLAGWAEFARLVSPLIERDNYGRAVTVPITPPNLLKASYAGEKKDVIRLEFDQPVIWTEALASQFYFDDAKVSVASGAVSGNVLTLTLSAPSSAKRITYLDSAKWKDSNLLFGANGIAALTFCGVTLLPAQ